MTYIPVVVETLEIAGLVPAMRAMRLPKRSVSDSAVGTLGSGDAALARKLILAGDSHAKALRGVVAWVQIRMQVGWMIEFETYRAGLECLSTSSAMQTDLAGMSGPELAEKKQADLPNKVYTRIVTISYQALRRMYLERRFHRHPDWRVFCGWIEGLPHFRELICPERMSETKGFEQ